MRRSADEAIMTLEGAGDDRLLCLALSHKSSLLSMAYRNHESIQIGERALTLARSIRDPAIVSHVLTSIGGSQGQLGIPEALATLREARQVALAAGSVGDVCRATCGIVGVLLRDLRHDEAMRDVTAAIELAEGAEQLRFLYHMHAYRAIVAMAASAWDQAMSDAEFVINARPLAKPPTRCPALVVLGRLRVRRGLPGGDELLAEAWELAQQTRELQNIGAVAVALAEAAWLRGDHAGMDPLLKSVYADAYQLGADVLRAELGYWLSKAGVPVPLDGSGFPYALSAAGQWSEAAAVWRKAGCTYEHAAALAESTDPADLIDALTALETLGAEPLAARVRARLGETR
jgi:hypothetical protein